MGKRLYYNYGTSVPQLAANGPSCIYLIGFLFFTPIDTGNELMRLKPHHTRIERISFPPWVGKQHQQQQKQLPHAQFNSRQKQEAKYLEKPTNTTGTKDQQKAKSSKNALAAMFLVTAPGCAKLFDMRNFVEVHQLNYGTVDSMKHIEQLQWVPRANLLLGEKHVKAAYKINFEIYFICRSIVFSYGY